MIGQMNVQESLCIHGRYVPSFLTMNLEFGDKKSIFDWKIITIKLSSCSIHHYIVNELLQNSFMHSRFSLVTKKI
jgi:hypothetical protein